MKNTCNRLMLAWLTLGAVAFMACLYNVARDALAREVVSVTVTYDDGTSDTLTPPPATQPVEPEPEPTTQPTEPSEGPRIRRVFEGFPVFFDSTDGGLAPTKWTTFTVQGGSTRRGYRPGYAFPAGEYLITVGNVPWTVLVAPYAPRKRVTITADADSVTEVAGLIASDVELVWAPDAETRLTSELVIPPEAVNLKLTDARFQLAPPVGKKAGIVVKAVGTRADRPTFRIDPARTDTKPWGRPFDVTAFTVAEGGQLVVRDGKASGVNTFLRTEKGNRGAVAENIELTDLRCYALYSNGGTAGVSWFGGTVRGHGYEPFFRVIDHPPDGSLATNYYVGFAEMWRADTSAAIGKDGVTFRGCARAASDSNKLHRCQHRSGQDDQGVDDGGSDPTDILTYGGTVDGGYYDHKIGRGKSARIHVINVAFSNPFVRPPIMFSGVTDGTVEGNRWIGGPEEWTPTVRSNTNLTVRGNGR